MAVKEAIEEHLRPLVIGREVNRIEEMWQLDACERVLAERAGGE